MPLNIGHGSLDLLLQILQEFLQELEYLQLPPILAPEIWQLGFLVLKTTFYGYLEVTASAFLVPTPSNVPFFTLIVLAELSDVWAFNVTLQQWAFMGGSALPNDLGVSGTKGVTSVNNYPKGRDTMLFCTNLLRNSSYIYGGSSGTDPSDLWYVADAVKVLASTGTTATTGTTGYCIKGFKDDLGTTASTGTTGTTATTGI